MFISQFCSINLLILLFLIVGLVLVRIKGKERRGVCFLATGTMLFVIFSLTPVANFILRPLETRYSLYNHQGTKIQYIVVLGNWHSQDMNFPLSSQLSSVSLTRLIEGIIIYHQNSGSKLVLSGNYCGTTVSNAKVMADVAMALGVQKENIILKEGALNTEEEAYLIGKFMKNENKPFVLVTSASHMTRSMKLFREQGLFPIPAPTYFRIRHPLNISLLPNTNALQSVDIALHEYLGLAWEHFEKYFWFTQK
jgi:uncharacterized SAM-binding protein YcdF (DUF218 family)